MTSPSLPTALYVPVLPLVQYCSRPALQFSHSRQESTMQPTPTRSPTLNLVTPGPTSDTMPAISWPGTIGKMASPQPSRAWWMSEWQMPANLMSIRTSCSRTSRRSMVVRSSGALAAGAAYAATVVMPGSPGFS